MRPQLADSLCCWRLADELSAALDGGVVRKLLGAGEAAFVLEVGVPGGLAGLLVGWADGVARAHLVTEARPGEEPAIVAAVRRQLTGALIRGVRQQAFDRVLVLELANLGGLGPEATGQLIVEATSREPNCLLLERGRIAAVAKPKLGREGVYRCLAAGEAYVPPPGGDKLDPARVPPGELAAAAAKAVAASQAHDQADKPLGAALRRAVQGLSRPFLAETLARADLDADVAPAYQPTGWAARWAEAVAALFDEAREGRAWLYRDEAGLPVLAYPAQLPLFAATEPSLAGGSWDEVEDLSAGLEAIGRRAEEDREREHMRVLVRRALKHEVTRKKKLLDRRARELREAKDVEKWRRWGELLVGNLHRLLPPEDEDEDAELEADALADDERTLPEGAYRPGDTEVEVVDYYSPDQATVKVPLSQGKGPRASAEDYFARYRKAQRAAERIPALVKRARHDLEAVKAEIARAEAAGDLAELAAMAEQWKVQEPRHGGHRAERGPSMGRTVAPAGQVVLFGRSALENDEVLRLARPSDIWLHARGVHGAHVIIRSDGAPEKVPHETLLWAARLAGKMSDYRRDGVADVDHTLARYVRKPRGSAPGFVTYTHQKTLRVDLGT